MDIAERRLVCALAFIVKYLLGKVIVVVSAFEYSVAEVYVLAVHEVVFVEQSYLIQHFAPQKAVSSAHHLNLRRFVPRQIAHVIVAEATALGVARAESGHLVESHHRRRQPTARLLGIAAVALQHTHSSRAGIGMRIHEIETTAYGGLAHYGVGIEQQHILAAALTYGHVVGPRKAPVVVALDVVYPRKTLTQKSH